MGSRRSNTPRGIDEEALSRHVTDGERAERGVYFTPAELVTKVLDAVAPLIPRTGRLRIIDPACGAGAFLVQAAQRWPRTEIIGIELNAETAALCRTRLSPSPPAGERVGERAKPRPQLDLPFSTPGKRSSVFVGNALVDDLSLPVDDAFELWLGNPPWNGTSPLLKDRAQWDKVRALLPSSFELKRGTSLREDFIFFLLQAARRLQARGRGVVAFVTSATLLDAYAHAPIRQALLSMVRLESVTLLPRGTFANTKVEPCFTVWSAAGTGASTPIGPEANLRPGWEGAAALDAKWRKHGAPLSELVPVSFAGLKTRFDELLVDDDRAALIRRVKAFIAGKATGLAGFDDKLAALREHMGDGVRFDETNVRPFLRYRGPNAMGADAWCYVDRRLIPRGDHRLRGDFDPHAAKVKLVFNVNELPLAAHVIDRPGCVTMYRHSRFAPDFVPRALLSEPSAREFDAKDLVPNLTERGLRLGSPREVFELIARHVMSEAFQKTWAPAFGTAQEPMINVAQ
jgi:SAM-dependent methyltransferase